MKKYAIVLVALLVAACAVAPETPRQRLAALEIGFTDAVKELKFNCDTNVLSESECKEAAPFVFTGNEALDLAHLRLDNGLPISGQIASLREALRNLPVGK